MVNNLHNSTAHFITIEFVLALPNSQKIEIQKFQKGMTLENALPFFALYHETLTIIEEPIYGVFNQRVDLDYALKDGDRIEVYRPLIIDPKKARQVRASRDPQFKRKK